MDRGQEATGSAIDDVSSVLPGSALTESCQSLHVAPDRTGIRFVLLRQRVRLGGLLLRQIESPNGRFDHCVPRRPKLLSSRSQKQGAVIRSVGVERSANGVHRCRPRCLNRRTHVTAPEAGHVLKPPDDVIPAHRSEQEHIDGSLTPNSCAVSDPDHTSRRYLNRRFPLTKRRISGRWTRTCPRSPIATKPSSLRLVIARETVSRRTCSICASSSW